MLDHHDGVALLDQPVQNLQQEAHVLEVKPRGRLVQDVERAASIPLGELGGQLYALRLTPRESRGALPQVDVAHPHVVEQLEPAADARLLLEELEGVGHRHVEHVGNGAAAVAHLQRLAVVAPPVADVARHIDVGQEVHLDLDQPVSAARLAAPPLHIEREPARAVSAQLGLGQLGV